MAKPTRPPVRASKKKASAPQPRAVAAVAGKPGKAAYEIICSECYTEFDFPHGFSAQRLSCPECMHVGVAADPEVMDKIAHAKRSERSALTLAAIPAVLLLSCGIGWIGYLMRNNAKLDPNINYMFAGVGALLLVTLLIFAVKYESKRYEVYF